MSMSNKIHLVLLLWQFVLIAHGQSYFNIIPELESIEGQGSCRVLFPRDSDFLVFGHRYDTSYEGSNAKPWYGGFTYESEMESQFSLRDETYENSFHASFLTFAQKDSQIWYGYSGRFINSNLTPYLYKLNIDSGEIVSSKLLPNKDYPNEGMAPVRIILNDNIISLLSYQQDSDSTRLYITELDTNFNLIREFRVEAAARKQFPKYFSRNNDGSYLLVLDSKRLIVDNFSTNNSSYMHIANDGSILNFKWSPSTFPLSNGLVQAKNVIRNENGDWIILSHHLIYHPDSCLFCAEQIPYIVSASPNFETVNWETRFLDIPKRIGPHNEVYTITLLADGYIGAGQFRQLDLIGYPSSGILFKAGLNGDSLWMKHYIPLGWQNERVNFAKFFDVKTTPTGSVIAAGEVSDDSLGVLLPWILHLDKDGCLVPGCNLVNTFEAESDEFSLDKFNIYPNPATTDIYLLSKIGSTHQITTQLVSNSGEIIKQTAFTPEKGYQYTLPIDDLPSGMYHIIFTDPETTRSESHSFFKH
jgi:type IX secretion system substrate protein